MKLQLKLCLLLLLFIPMQVQADTFTMPGSVANDELVKPFPQPYVVQKGDTLWDIAQEYFADPEKWLKIWEQNLYVSNPDLIYPGNEIWLNMQKPKKPEVAKKVEPKRPMVKLEPRIIYKPAERSEAPIDTSVLITALARQDFIDTKAIEGVGHIIDSEDDRLNYGANDRVYMSLDVRAKAGDRFNIFRTGDPIYAFDDEDNKTLVGYLVNHLGTVEVISEEGGIFRGVITQAFEEIGRTDRLKRALPTDYSIKLDYPDKPVFGHVTYIRGNTVEAGQGQVIGIDLGSEDGLRAGTVLGVYRPGKLVIDGTYEEKTYRALPEEKIGEIIVLAAQEKASIAIIQESSSPINIKNLIQPISRK
ncbi:MAG TPA: LysM peptidoglycan-binding domain-containing protein [Ghiorsea sp.]|nr:LysM peptidoglycan-binding domain-containing protein [Ghiorsea sp.]HIP06636.1 LysM peptidoglycan-binding domain-containing protein [Mariprofundaceae bacterium]